VTRSCPAGLDARRAALLFVLAGALSIVNAWTPGVAPADARLPFTGLGLLDFGVAAAFALLPWDRWGRRALYAIPLITLPIVDVFAITGELDGWLYAMFFVALAVWVGLSLPSWTNLWLAPLYVAAYVAPLLVHGHGHEAATTVGVVVPLVVACGQLVAEVVRRQRVAIAALSDASLRDELTGVGNRRYGMSALARLRVGDVVLLLDLDGFKAINDRHGHAAGDAVLADLGGLLLGSMRGVDAVARYGGEEFLVVLSQAEVAAREIAERLLADWRARSPRATLSCGVAVHEAGETPEETLARADAALYEAKRLGRDRACVAPAPGN
jgi:diguanylate cyclase (GGDEF)-like protein